MDLRLNIGCGKYPLPDYLNIDPHPGSRADVLADGRALPLPDGAANEVYAGHVLEHLDWDDGQRLLRELRRVVRPGGRVTVVVPNAREMMLRHLARTGDVLVDEDGRQRHLQHIRTLNEVLFYNRLSPGSPHCWCYDREHLEEALAAAGLVVEAEVDPWRDGRIADPIRGQRWLNLGLEARRPEEEDG